jgi:hypothetical protein
LNFLDNALNLLDVPIKIIAVRLIRAPLSPSSENKTPVGNFRRASEHLFAEPTSRPARGLA